MLDEKARELLDTLNRNVTVLQREVGQCRSMIGMLLDRDVNESVPDVLQYVSRSACRENRLRESLIEAIDTLEESRKAFKSKRLEALRRKLTQVLMEAQESSLLKLFLSEDPVCSGSGDCGECTYPETSEDLP